MRKFNQSFKIGTKVKVDGDVWSEVTRIHETKNWIQVKGYEGSFQRSDIIKYSNKKGKK